jgi:signal transduction histidine kinase
MRTRITLAASLVTAIAVALAGWLLIRSIEDTQEGEIREAINDQVATAASRLEDGLPVRRALADSPEVFVSDDDETCSLVRTSEGQMDLLCTGAAMATADPGAPPVPSEDGTVETELGAGGGTGGADAGGSIAIRAGEGADVVQREVDSERYGPLTLTAVAPVDEVARSVSAVTKALWVMLPGLVGVVALVAWWLTGRTLRPVEAIRLQAESIGGSTIDRRLPVPASDDEIGRLARTMNAMLGRLEESSLRQRQFVSDASHELRSPVAAIRTDLEVALHEGDRADWPTVARAVLSEEARLERLLGDLLVLASDDESAAAAAATMVDIGQLAADEAARTRRVPVTVDLPEVADPDAYVVAGVAARLDRALTNLVDNAARHADSQVQIAVSRYGARVRVVVDDDGSGIKAIDRERIFERFTRLDAGRARQQGGAGLGLAVVRTIVTRHGGYVWADNSPLGGARFTFELPAAQPTMRR